MEEKNNWGPKKEKNSEKNLKNNKENNEKEKR